MNRRVPLAQVGLYLLPAAVFTLCFFVLPAVAIAPLSLLAWDGIGRARWVGFANFRALWEDGAFRASLVNTAGWIGAAVLLHVPLGLLLALVLNRQPCGWKLFRTVFFLPNVLSVSSLAIIWYFLLNPDLGLVNHALRALGLEKMARPWLSDPGTALGATQVPFVLYVGFTMLVFLAQMTAIPRDYYEAAEIDGASRWQQDLYITIPLVRRAVAINVLFNTAFVLRMVEYPLIMTGGGPAGSTLTVPLYMYQKMTIAYSYGTATAAGVVATLAGAVISAAVLLGLRRSERWWG